MANGVVVMLASFCGAVLELELGVCFETFDCIRKLVNPARPRQLYPTT